MEGKDKNEMVEEQRQGQMIDEREESQEKSQLKGLDPPELKSQESLSAKKIGIKKVRLIIDDFTEYLPQLLVLINHHKPKSMIRIGKNYQAIVPRNCSFSHVYRPLNQVKIWSNGEFNREVFRKFKQKFGDNRTQEELIEQIYQYQCDWDQIWNYLKNNQDLRKYYLQKDRNKF